MWKVRKVDGIVVDETPDLSAARLDVSGVVSPLLLPSLFTLIPVFLGGNAGRCSLLGGRNGVGGGEGNSLYAGGSLCAGGFAVSLSLSSGPSINRRYCRHRSFTVLACHAMWQST